MTVHVLEHGMTLCGISPPCDWPEGDVWVARYELKEPERYGIPVDLVICEECRRRYEEEPCET